MAFRAVINRLPAPLRRKALGLTPGGAAWRARAGLSSAAGPASSGSKALAVALPRGPSNARFFFEASAASDRPASARAARRRAAPGTIDARPAVPPHDYRTAAATMRTRRGGRSRAGRGEDPRRTAQVGAGACGHFAECSAS